MTYAEAPKSNRGHVCLGRVAFCCGLTCETGLGAAAERVLRKESRNNPSLPAVVTDELLGIFEESGRIGPEMKIIPANQHRSARVGRVGLG